MSDSFAEMMARIIEADLKHKEETGWSYFEEPQKEEGAQDEQID